MFCSASTLFLMDKEVVFGGLGKKQHHFSTLEGLEVHVGCRHIMDQFLYEFLGSAGYSLTWGVDPGVLPRLLDS